MLTAPQKKTLTLAVALVLAILFIDQASKIWVKTHMYLGDSIPVFDHWFYIHFTENYGMAFGLEFGGSFGKLFLSVFRIAASVAIAWYIVRLVKDNVSRWMVVSFSFILAGAVGNILDSAFYGLLFSDSMQGISTFLPPEGGYDGFLHGRVVDMLYFPMFHGQFPSWLPIWGGESFLFFRPVFNIADSSITVGVILFLLFHKSLEVKSVSQEENNTEASTPTS